MSEISWPLVVGLGATGILMALLSALVGMRQRAEVPAWWALYAIWVVIVLQMGAPPFRTVLFASLIAGVLHAMTVSLLLDAYVRSNPWYADKMNGPPGRVRRQLLLSGVLIGAGFGAIVGGIAWGIARL